MWSVEHSASATGRINSLLIGSLCPLFCLLFSLLFFLFCPARLTVVSLAFSLSLLITSSFLLTPVALAVKHTSTNHHDACQHFLTSSSAPLDPFEIRLAVNKCALTVIKGRIHRRAEMKDPIKVQIIVPCSQNRPVH